MWFAWLPLHGCMAMHAWRVAGSVHAFKGHTTSSPAQLTSTIHACMQVHPIIKVLRFDNCKQPPTADLCERFKVGWTLCIGHVHGAMHVHAVQLLDAAMRNLLYLPLPMHHKSCNQQYCQWVEEVEVRVGWRRGDAAPANLSDSTLRLYAAPFLPAWWLILILSDHHRHLNLAAGGAV